jgi:hypothetical protein
MRTWPSVGGVIRLSSADTTEAEVVVTDEAREAVLAFCPMTLIWATTSVFVLF